MSFLKNFKMTDMVAILDIRRKDFSNSESPCQTDETIPSMKFRLKPTFCLGGAVNFEEFKMTAMVAIFDIKTERF